MRRLIYLAVLALAPCAGAQIVEAYATFSPTHAGNVQTGSVLIPTGTGNQYTYQEQYTSFFAPAIGGGVTFSVIPLGPLRLGFDLRGSTRPGVNGVDTALFGVKLAVKPPLLPIKPYVQVSGGYVATRTGNVSTVTSGSASTTAGGTFTNQYAAFEGIAGVDYHFLPFLNLRLVEVGYGKGYDTGISTGSFSTQNNLNFFTINTGVVAHF